MNTEDRATMMLRNIIEMGKLSFDQEEKREQSIITQTGQMLTAFSIFSAVLLMMIPILADVYPLVKQKIVLGMCFILPLLLASFLLALLAQYRYKYSSIKSVKEIYDEVYKNHEQYPDEDSFRLQWIDQIQLAHESKKTLNDRRARLVIASMLVFFIAIVFSAFIVLFIALQL